MFVSTLPYHLTFWWRCSKPHPPGGGVVTQAVWSACQLKSADITMTVSTLPWLKLVEALLYVHRNRRCIRDGSPGRPPRLSHTSWTQFALPLTTACFGCSCKPRPPGGGDVAQAVWTARGLPVDVPVDHGPAPLHRHVPHRARLPASQPA